MRQYTLLLMALLLLSPAVGLGYDYDELLTRLDTDPSTEFSLEASTSWLGNTNNPYGDTTCFKARAEFLTLSQAAFGSAEKQAEINAFLVNSLAKKISIETKVWLIQQLGALGTSAEVPALAAQLGTGDKRLVGAAAVALAQIPGPEATAALEAKKSIPDVAAALVERNRAIPAFNPAETEFPGAVAFGDAAAVDKWVAGFDAMDTQAKVQTITGLTQRQDRKYFPLILSALKSDVPEVQKAAWLALEKFGGKDQIDDLLSNLAADRSGTIRICGFIDAPGFDDALIARLKSEQDATRQIVFVTILCNRSTDIRSIVFGKTSKADCPNRMGLLQQVVLISTKADAADFVAAALQTPDGGDRDTVENYIAQLCQSDASPVIALIGKYKAEQLYSILGRIGGDAALAELNRGLASKNEDTREAALKALSAWPNATVADRLWEIANDNGYSKGQKISALRGFIRVISLPDDKIGIRISRDERLARLQEAFRVSTRADEKKLILSRLSANRTVASLKFAVECASNADLAEAAYLAIADHAHDNTLRQQNMGDFLPAMDLVISKSTDKNLVDRVKRYKEQK